MELYYAIGLANKTIEPLRPWCDKIEYAGSIRRRQPICRDIDIVAIPSNPGQFLTALQKMNKDNRAPKGKEKMLQIFLPGMVQVDIYIATPATWATIFLIRTGSKEHNRMLCTRARQMGMVLHADGRGLAKIPPDGEIPIPCGTEGEIFKALALPFKEPAERECM